MIYVYCPRGSNGAYELIKGLGGARLRRFDGLDFWDRKKRVKLEPGSSIVCWGASVPEFDGVTVYNSLEAPLNKLQAAAKLVEAGVATISFTPAQVGTPREAYEQAGYIGRTFRHEGGMDLLMKNVQPDFYVLRERFAAEFRIHSFAGRSIRAGKKVHRDGFKEASELEWKPNFNLIHPWIRSFDGGWKIKYDEFKSTAEMRALAHSAVKALGLTFGAVDIAQLGGGALKVLEVNTAPGADPNTTAAYVKAITRLVEGKGKDKEPEI